MKLDRNTYEAWLLDRSEGRLSPEQERELDDFLAANPDLDGSTGELPVVQAQEADIDWKSGLRKSFPPTGDVDGARLDDFLIARGEKDLTPEQERALDRFLYEHPERTRDARAIAASRVEPTNERFAEKATVERHFPPQGLPDAHRLTDFLIAAQEGDLTADQRRALEAYVLVHPEAAREARLIAAAQVSRETIVFAPKEHLKKKEGRVIALWLRYASAASIALMLGLAWWMGQGQADQVADQEKVQPVPPRNTGTTANEPANATAGPAVAQPGTNVPGARPVTNGATPGEAGDSTEHGRRERTPVPQPTRLDEPGSAPEPKLAVAPQPKEAEPHTGPAPTLDPAPIAQQPPMQEPAPHDAPLVDAVDPSAEGGTPVGTVLANAVRASVIGSDKRDASLDNDDALALVNKGLGSITGGDGRVQVDSKGERDRWKLRLGRNFAISASTGR